MLNEEQDLLPVEYESLKAAFGVARYADIPDQDWPRVVQWFRTQLEPWRCVVQNLVRKYIIYRRERGSMVSQKNFTKVEIVA
jgi:hypothetical protein